jgi:hypothetical protein
MSTTIPESDQKIKLAPFEERAEQLLSKVFGGMHHVYSARKEPLYWSCEPSGDLSTYDFDTLTRLVFAAHEFCIRVSIINGGPRALKIMLHPRDGTTGAIYTRHPTLIAAIERWNNT